MSDHSWFIDTEPSGKRRAGRRFSAMGLGFLSPRLNWREPLRPWWASFACEEGAFRPFLANLITGRPVEVTRNQKAVFQKSAGYVYRKQTLGEGMVACTVYLPELFDLEPEALPPTEDDAEPITRVVLLPDEAWFVRSALTTHDVSMAWMCARSVEMARAPDLKRLIAPGRRDDVPLAKLGPVPDPQAVSLAALLGAQLDHRLRVPLLPDVGFYLHLLRVLYLQRYAVQPSHSETRGYEWNTLPGSGYCEPTILQAKTSDIEHSVALAIDTYIPSE